MSLLNKLETIQKKPERIKRRILFFSLFMLMFIITAVWVSTLKVTLGSKEDSAKKTSISSPFSVFKDIIGDSVGMGVDGVKDSLGKLKQSYGESQGQ